MHQPTSTGRRLTDSFAAYERGDDEGALIHFFPALDKTAKRRRPREGVGERIRNFIHDQEAIISVVATGNLITGLNVDGMTFPKVIYKFGRTSIAHEGELDSRLQLTATGDISIGQIWALPRTYIPALCVGVMVAEENSNESLGLEGEVSILGRKRTLSALWGTERALAQEINEFFERTPYPPG